MLSLQCPGAKLTASTRKEKREGRKEGRWGGRRQREEEEGKRRGKERKTLSPEDPYLG